MLLRWVRNLLLTSIAIGAAAPLAHASETKHDALLESVHQFLYEETQALGNDVVINLRAPSLTCLPAPTPNHFDQPK